MTKTHTIYLLPSGKSVGTWQQRLRKELGLIRVGTERVRNEYYDSFDWRLFNAGLLLECCHDELASRICLKDLNHGSRNLCSLCNEPSVPLVARLPEGEPGRRIKSLLGLRALIPVSAIRADHNLFSVIDTEGKTRLRVVLEVLERELPKPTADDRRVLIRLEPLRGYQKTARNFARKLETVFSLAPDANDHVRWLLGGSREPGAYSSRIRVELDAAMRADAAVRRVLLHLLNTMESNEAGIIEQIDTEFLHDFRVAVRRTRSALGQIKTVFRPSVLQHYRQEFAWLGTITGPVRDLDVYLLKFDAYQKRVPGDLQPELEPLREFLEQRRASGQAELVAQLTSSRYRTLKSRWRRYLSAELSGRPATPDAGKPILYMAQCRTWKMYKRVYHEGIAITPASPASELHELRKSCKKLRYLMEFFQTLYPQKTIRAAIRELKQLQDNIGDFHDFEVQIHTLEAYSKEMAGMDISTPRTYLAMGALLDNLAAGKEQTRYEFKARFAKFAEAENRKLFRALFKTK